jgi:hypothetical protein
VIDLRRTGGKGNETDEEIELKFGTDFSASSLNVEEEEGKKDDDDDDDDDDDMNIL